METTASPSSSRAHRSVGPRLYGLLAGAVALAGLAGWFALYPLDRWMAGILVGGYGLLVAARPSLWLVLMPALWPVVDLAPWSGQIHVTESDALALVSRGLGEAAVAAGWLLVVVGSDYVQRGAFALAPLQAGLSYALLVAAILFINEFPDRRGDAAAGKRTLVVRLGPDGAKWAWLGLAEHAVLDEAAAPGEGEDPLDIGRVGAAAGVEVIVEHVDAGVGEQREEHRQRGAGGIDGQPAAVGHREADQAGAQGHPQEGRAGGEQAGQKRPGAQGGQRFRRSHDMGALDG